MWVPESALIPDLANRKEVLLDVLEKILVACCVGKINKKHVRTGLGWVLVFLLILLTVLFLSMALARWNTRFFNLPYSS